MPVRKQSYCIDHELIGKRVRAIMRIRNRGDRILLEKQASRNILRIVMAKDLTSLVK